MKIQEEEEQRRKVTRWQGEGRREVGQLGMGVVAVISVCGEKMTFLAAQPLLFCGPSDFIKAEERVGGNQKGQGKLWK